MRDDHVEPADGTNHEDSPTSRRLTSDVSDTAAEQSDGTPADAPAPLSAVSHPADVEDAGLSDEEIALYRRRVAEGVYNSREVADEVARRMMRRGDI